MANSVRINVELGNFKEFAAMLTELPDAVQARVMQRAVEVSLKPLVSEVRKRVPVRSGALRRSIIGVSRNYKRWGKVIAFVGPELNARFFGGKRVRRGGSKLGTDAPYKYAHLVEFGHFAVGDKYGGIGFSRAKGANLRKGIGWASAFIPAQPFMRPGVEAGLPRAMAALGDGVAVGIAREQRRLVSKLRRLKRR